VNDYAILYAVLVAIYLLDCVVWLPASAHPLRARPRRPWSAAFELISLQSGRWTAWLAGIVPGTGGLVRTEAEPLLLSPAGLCACVISARGTPIPIDSLREVSAEENEVRLGARTIGRLATTSFARPTAAWLRERAVAPAVGRARLIETRLEARLEAMLDVRAARHAVRRYRWCVAPLGLPVRVLALSMYAVVPFELFRRGLPGILVGLLVLLALMVAVLWQFSGRLRRLGHGKQVPGDVAMMILAPPLAIRADDLAGRELMAGLHMLAVTAAACSEEEAKTRASLALRAIRYPLAREGESCCEAARWARERWHQAIERWVAGHFGSPEVLLAPPSRESDRSRAYCPRCAQQFERAEGRCPDCVEIDLMSFA
jgi:hypothetical protein